jgi:hypothetical protein
MFQLSETDIVSTVQSQLLSSEDPTEGKSLQVELSHLIVQGP